MVALSFSAVCGVLMSQWGVITPQVNWLAIAMSSSPQQMTSTFVRWFYTTSIRSTCMRRSRKWYASSSRPILRSNGGIEHLKSTRLWRCGTHQEGVVSMLTFFATRRCGEVGFGQYVILLQTGTVLMTGIGGNFQTQGTCYDKDLHDWFLFIITCTDTGVIATHALSFYRPLAPLFCWLMRSSLLWLRAAPYCTLLRTVTYCCSDAIVLVTPIVRTTLLFSYST